MSGSAVTESAKLERWVTQQKQINIVIFLALAAMAIWQWAGRQQLNIEQQSETIQVNAVRAELRVLRAQIGKARDLDELQKWMADPDKAAGLRDEEATN